MTELEKEASKYAGFKPNQNPNSSEERYFATHKCQIYDAYLAGAKSSLEKLTSAKQALLDAGFNIDEFLK